MERRLYLLKKAEYGILFLSLAVLLEVSLFVFGLVACKRFLAALAFVGDALLSCCSGVGAAAAINLFLKFVEDASKKLFGDWVAVFVFEWFARESGHVVVQLRFGDCAGNNGLVLSNVSPVCAARTGVRWIRMT